MHHLALLRFLVNGGAKGSLYNNNSKGIHLLFLDNRFQMVSLIYCGCLTQFRVTEILCQKSDLWEIAKICLLVCQFLINFAHHKTLIIIWKLAYYKSKRTIVAVFWEKIVINPSDRERKKGNLNDIYIFVCDHWLSA